MSAVEHKYFWDVWVLGSMGEALECDKWCCCIDDRDQYVKQMREKYASGIESRDVKIRINKRKLVREE